VIQIESDRKKNLDATTEAYEKQREQDWYFSTRAGTCIRAETPSSPADLVSFDRLNALEDNVLILKRDDAGKASVVRVGEPEANGLEMVYMFFRGANECEAYLKVQKQQMNDLK
jgi:hypothetical protein